MHRKYNDVPKVFVICDQFIAFNADDNSDYLCINLFVQYRYRRLGHKGWARKTSHLVLSPPFGCYHGQARFAATRKPLPSSTVSLPGARAAMLEEHPAQPYLNEVWSHVSKGITEPL